MGKLTRPSQARLKQIFQRQDPPGFGPDYVPAIKPTREEAPSRSRPAWVWGQRVGRRLSTLSSVERAVLLICLYNKQLWEVHDQRMLPPMARPHPLSGHPKAVGLNLPLMRGTLDVADSLGLIKFHPFIRIPIEGTTDLEVVPFPWTGDLLLFLEDAQGPYNVNLDIKGEQEEFKQSEINGILRGCKLEKSQQKTKARHAIEAQLYADVGIRTLQLSRRSYDENLAANLKQLLPWVRRPVGFSNEQREEIINSFNGTLVTGVQPIEVAWGLSVKYGWTLYDVKIVFYQAIWNRNIRVDLFQPVEIDRPLNPERRDALSVYGDWFSR